MEMSRLLAEEGAFGDEIQLFGSVLITKEGYQPAIFSCYSDYACVLVENLQKANYLPLPVVHTWRSKAKLSPEKCMEQMLVQIQETFSDEYCKEVQNHLGQAEPLAVCVMDSVIPATQDPLLRSMFGYCTLRKATAEEEWILNGNYGGCVRSWIQDICQGNQVGPIYGKQDYSIQMHVAVCQKDFLEKMQNEKSMKLDGNVKSDQKPDKNILDNVLQEDAFFCGLFCKKTGEKYE